MAFLVFITDRSNAIFLLWFYLFYANKVVSHLGFWSGNFFLIVPVPGNHLLVPFGREFETGFIHFVSSAASVQGVAILDTI